MGSGSQQCYNANDVKEHARSDYAGNAGDTFVGWDAGPTPGQAAAGKGFRDMGNCTGIFYQRSMVSIADVRDGTSHTYLVGEKYLNPDHYLDGEDYSDDQSAWCSDDFDMHAWTGTGRLPYPDQAGYPQSYIFGSAHPSGWNVVMVDGSVHHMPYDIDPEIHRRLGNRQDGQQVDGNQF